VHARAYLVLGSLATVDSETQWLQDHLPPFGVIDAPAVGAEVHPGSTTISGWALDNRGVASLEAVIDETVHVPLSYGGARPDVCLAWPGYPGCDGVGYSGTHDFGPAQECPHLLQVFATDGDGNQRLIANTLVTVTP
jgi:N-acetylmuramoyl-L-alanine amidase